MLSLVEKTPVKKRNTQSNKTRTRQPGVVKKPEYSTEKKHLSFLHPEETDASPSRINTTLRKEEYETIRFVERATFAIVFLGITPLILFYILNFFFPDFLMIPASPN